MIAPSYEVMAGIYEYLQFPWYAKPYDLNLFGIRNPNPKPDAWDDTIGIAFRDRNGYGRVAVWPGTTDPGLYYLQNPLTSSGCIIVDFGHHPKCYRRGLHRGYKALKQVAPMRYLFDVNKDGVLDWNTSKRETSLRATNMHRGLENSIVATVGKFSAGCQVVQHPNDFAYLLSIVDLQAAWIGSDLLSYTVFNEADVLLMMKRSAA